MSERVFDPNLEDVDGGTQYLHIVITFLVLNVLSTGLRIAAKVLRRVKLTRADYFILLSFTCNMVCNGMEIRSIQHGFGRHSQFLSMADLLEVRKLTEIVLPPFILATTFTKISISFFLIAIIRDVHRRSKIIIYGLMIVTIVCTTASTVMWALQAQPLRKLWEPQIPGTVMSSRVLVITATVSTATTAFTDLFYSLAPIYFFGRLNMPLKNRLYVLSLTGAGLIVPAMSLARIGLLRTFLSPDFTWDLRADYIVSIIERSLGEIIANLPATVPLFRGMGKSVSTMLSSRRLLPWSRVDEGKSNQEVASDQQIRTIGGRGQASNGGPKLTSFAAYGFESQLVSKAGFEEEDYPLQARDNKVDGYSITVQRSFETQSQHAAGEGQETRSATWV